MAAGTTHDDPVTATLYKEALDLQTDPITLSRVAAERLSAMTARKVSNKQAEMDVLLSFWGETMQAAGKIASENGIDAETNKGYGMRYHGTKQDHELSNMVLNLEVIDGSVFVATLP